MNDADCTHALVARCLTEAMFLDNALSIAQSNTLEALASEEGDLTNAIRTLGVSELERLALFRGFITKVRNNALRPILPLTFRLLAMSKQEVSFFAAYSCAYTEARSSGPIPIEQQLSSFATHLHLHFQSRRPDLFPWISTVLSHEVLLWQIHASPQGAGALEMIDDTWGKADAALAWRGILAVRHYRVDLLAALAALEARHIDLAAGLPERNQLLVYWLPDGVESVFLLEVDALTGIVLSLVDGHRTMEGIAGELRAFAGQDLSTSDVAKIFEAALRRGIAVQYLDVPHPRCACGSSDDIDT
jgi:hypothetical protein